MDYTKFKCLSFRIAPAYQRSDHTCATKFFLLISDKTRSLLFEGSRRSNCHTDECGISSDLQTDDRSEPDLRPVKGQLRLDEHGYICGDQENGHVTHTAKALMTIDENSNSCSAMDCSDQTGCSHGNSQNNSPTKLSKQLVIDFKGKLADSSKGTDLFP